ncbi:hypothetical protein EU537_06445, partial [Candidatus Thorarchaeota archaeon]
MKSNQTSQKMPYVCVEKKHGEEIRRALLEHDLLNPAFRIISKDNRLYFPLKRNHETAERLLLLSPRSLTFGTRRFEEIVTPPSSLPDALKGYLSQDELEMIPRAYDLVGDIAVLEVPEELDAVKEQIGRHFLKIHPNFETVLNK